MTSEPARPSVFFRITIGLFALLALLGVLMAVALIVSADRINRDGGYGWLMAIVVFVAATALVCAMAVVTSAVSIWRGEAHRRLSIGILIVCCLVAGTFGFRLVVTGWSQLRQSQEAASEPLDGPRRESAERGSDIPDALVEHFRRQGFVLKPVVGLEARREWILDSADAGPRCEVVLRFRGFARALPAEAARKRLMEFNLPSVFNEHASLAMFHPFARGTTPDKIDCDRWVGKADAVVEPLLEAFRSYRP